MMGLAEFLTASASWIFPGFLLAWLAVCAWLDWRYRQVPNALTLPVIGIALIFRLAGTSTSPTWLIGGLCLLVVTGWAFKVVGGADTKATIALSLLDPRLAVWAWAGACLWFTVLFTVTRGRQSPYRLPGFMGFLIGACAWIGMGL